ncbi:MAG: SPFH domain-containing protein [Ilumatobacteraceae bacterium]
MLALGTVAIGGIVVLAIVLLVILTGLRQVSQGTVAVTTVFGKYKRALRPGLNVVTPFVERIYRRISVQNRAVELQFQAITQDQANVYFTAMMVYSVLNEGEDTIKNVAFKFFSEKDFLTALVRSVEGSTRGFVATMRQAEILGLRGEIVKEVKENLDVTLETWGYHLMDLQLNDITFDQAITTSMAQVVASNNLKAAATNEGDALLIRRTKEAEAEGTAIRIAAEAERTAAQLRGQGVALFREEVSRGLAQAARELEDNNTNSSLILFSMWTETIRHMAENGKGNVMFLDGSPDGMDKQMKDLMAMQQLSTRNLPPPPGGAR